MSSDAEVEVAEVALKPPQHLGEAYEPNVEYRAFRVVLAAEGEACAAAVHVATDEPRAEVALRVLQVVPVDPSPSPNPSLSPILSPNPNPNPNHPTLTRWCPWRASCARSRRRSRRPR